MEPVISDKDDIADRASSKATRSGFERLTAKEREALELVHARLSSKEIGIRLGVSRKTIDQRLDNARLKLGASTRISAARTYAAMAGISERFPYAPIPVSQTDPFAPHEQGISSDGSYTLNDSMTFVEQLPWSKELSPDVPEFIALRMGALSRLILILLGAVAILALASLGLSLSEGASALFRR